MNWPLSFSRLAKKYFIHIGNILYWTTSPNSMTIAYEHDFRNDDTCFLKQCISSVCSLRDLKIKIFVNSVSVIGVKCTFYAALLLPNP